MVEVTRMDRLVEILIVEDNPADVLLAREALKLNDIPKRLNVVPDGVEAMAFLRREGPYVNAPQPDFILLDLNLPEKNGLEVLSEIKTDENLRSIPVAILTSSEMRDDVIRCYNLHANCYIIKPGDMEQFTRMIKCIEEFWFNVVKLPHISP